jgi:hypothetical protein
MDARVSLDVTKLAPRPLHVIGSQRGHPRDKRDLRRRDDPGTRINNPGQPELGASRRTIVAPGSRACAIDSSPGRADSVTCFG